MQAITFLPGKRSLVRWSIFMGSFFLLLPLTFAATSGTSLTEVVTEAQVEGQTTPEPCDLSKGGCEASIHPNGPNCDPSSQFCDIGGSGGNFVTRFRAEEVLQNNIVTLLLGGFQVFSPYWDTYEYEHGEEKSTIILKAITGNSIAKTRRGLLDLLLKNGLRSDITIPETDTINPEVFTNTSNLIKPTPGIFPLGYQYELTPEVESYLDRKRGECATNDTDCISSYTPSLDYSIIPLEPHHAYYTGPGSYITGYRSVLTGEATTYLSQKLKRILRLKPQSICTKTTCQKAGYLTFIFSQESENNYFDAVTTCGNQGGRLPSSQELEWLVQNNYIQPTVNRPYTTDFINHKILEIGQYPWHVYSIERQSNGNNIPNNIDTMTSIVSSSIRPLYCIID